MLMDTPGIIKELLAIYGCLRGERVGHDFGYNVAGIDGEGTSGRLGHRYGEWGHRKTALSRLPARYSAI